MKLDRDGKLAELIGIFHGAGIISDSHIIISIDKKREVYIDHVVNLIESVIEVRPYKKTKGEKVKLIISNPEVVFSFDKSMQTREISNYFYIYV